MILVPGWRENLSYTRAVSDDVSAVAEVVYTAFGEIVRRDLSVETRYSYAAEHGYECFDDLDWGSGGVFAHGRIKMHTT